MAIPTIFLILCCCCSVAQSCPTLCDPMICRMPNLPVPHHLPEFPQVHDHCTVMLSSHFILWCPLLLLASIFPSFRDFSNEFASDDQNTLQGIFPTQESNRGLLHCRPIVYQLSYQESPPSHTAFNKRITTWSNLGVIFLISLQRQKCHCSTKKRPMPNPDWRHLLPFMP